MRGFTAFFKKEILALIRSGKLLFLGILFVLFGIMNPAIAKLTPLLYELLSDSMAENGIVITNTDVNALQAWIQFFKNIPIAMIVVLVMFAGSFANEYSKGSLVLPITKGLSKTAVSVVKLLTVELVWTAGYWLCYGITYAYSDYYWDNSILFHLGEAAGFNFLLGVFLIAVMMCFAVITDSIAAPLIGTGAVFLASYLFGLLPKCAQYVPSYLSAVSPLYTGAVEPKEYISAFIVTMILSICAVIGMITLGKRKV